MPNTSITKPVDASNTLRLLVALDPRGPRVFIVDALHGELEEARELAAAVECFVGEWLAAREAGAPLCELGDAEHAVLEEPRGSLA